MKLLYLNPNSTESMTRQVVDKARLAMPQAEIIGWTNTAGPPTIQGPHDGEAALAGVMDLVPAIRTARPDAVIIACFDDVGLPALSAALDMPVLGIGQSAYQMAALAGGAFGVITTLAASVPVLEQNLEQCGLRQSCLSVRASGLPVLTVEAGGAGVINHLSAEIAALAQAGCRAVALGCAGMAGLHAELASRSPVMLVEGVAASAFLAQAMIGYRQMNMTHA